MYSSDILAAADIWAAGPARSSPSASTTAITPPKPTPHCEPVFLKACDRVEIEIAGIGILENIVQSA
jgi:2-keto-4-pentenoate hydratase/2-oxohepta-3-ene-1,7-dioic acid hydratase in catechol pathway